MDNFNARSAASIPQRAHPTPVAAHTAPQPVPPVQPVSTPAQPHTRAPRTKRFRFKKLFAAIAILVILAGLVLGGLFFFRQNSGTAIDSSKYQAVFLSSGQVYFGKLQNSNGDYLKLTNVFYLQTKTDTASQNPQQATATNDNVELVKLGGEIHGPLDEMVISRSQVLFFENLKSDGRVSQSIANFK